MFFNPRSEGCEPFYSCAARYFERVRSLFLGHALQVNHKDQGTGPFVKELKYLFKSQASIDLFFRAFHQKPVFGQVFQPFIMFFPPEKVKAFIDCDPVYPGEDVALAAKSVDV